MEKAPAAEALIACEIDVGSPLVPQWEQRTYHAIRRQGGSDWVVLVGDGWAHEVFPTWERVRSWLGCLQPRAVEVLHGEPEAQP